LAFKGLIINHDKIAIFVFGKFNINLTDKIEPLSSRG